jgi:hypothetical protein
MSNPHPATKPAARKGRKGQRRSSRAHNPFTVAKVPPQ